MRNIRGVQCGACNHRFNGNNTEHKNPWSLKFQLVCPSCKQNLENSRFMKSRFIYTLVILIPILSTLLGIYFLINKMYILASLFVLIVLAGDKVFYYLVGVKKGYVVMQVVNESS